MNEPEWTKEKKPVLQATNVEEVQVHVSSSAPSSPDEVPLSEHFIKYIRYQYIVLYMIIKFLISY